MENSIQYAVVLVTGVAYSALKKGTVIKSLRKGAWVSLDDSYADFPWFISEPHNLAGIRVLTSKFEKALYGI